VPAAAVIPAPIAYIKVVAVKTLVVGSEGREAGSGPKRPALGHSALSVMPSGLCLSGFAHRPAGAVARAGPPGLAAASSRTDAGP